MPSKHGFPETVRLPVMITDQAPPEGHSWLHGSSYDRAWLGGWDPPPLYPTSLEKTWFRRLSSMLRRAEELGTVLPGSG